MSKRETPMTHWYWAQVGGTLCEEFLAVPSSPTTGPRRIDGVILPDGPNELRDSRSMSVDGQDVIVVQAKASRLGMSVMGQTLFSADLIRRLGAKSVRGVALCLADDGVLRPLLEAHPGMTVVVAPSSLAPKKLS